jgi:hypothetical protein
MRHLSIALLCLLAVTGCYVRRSGVQPPYAHEVVRLYPALGGIVLLGRDEDGDRVSPWLRPLAPAGIGPTNLINLLTLGYPTISHLRGGKCTWAIVGSCRYWDSPAPSAAVEYAPGYADDIRRGGAEYHEP